MVEVNKKMESARELGEKGQPGRRRDQSAVKEKGRGQQAYSQYDLTTPRYREESAAPEDHATKETHGSRIAVKRKVTWATVLTTVLEPRWCVKEALDSEKKEDDDWITVTRRQRAHAALKTNYRRTTIYWNSHKPQHHQRQKNPDFRNKYSDYRNRCFRCLERGHMASGCCNARRCLRCDGIRHFAFACSRPINRKRGDRVIVAGSSNQLLRGIRKHDTSYRDTLLGNHCSPPRRSESRTSRVSAHSPHRMEGRYPSPSARRHSQSRARPASVGRMQKCSPRGRSRDRSLTRGRESHREESSRLRQTHDRKRAASPRRTSPVTQPDPFAVEDALAPRYVGAPASVIVQPNEEMLNTLEYLQGYEVATVTRGTTTPKTLATYLP